MATLQLLQEIVKDGAILLGAISALATTLSHTPGLPARTQSFLARIGVATGKFGVWKKDAPTEAP